MNKNSWETISQRYQGAVTKLANVQMMAHVCGLILILCMLLTGLPVDQLVNIHVISLLIGVAILAASHSVNYMFTLFAISHLSKLDTKNDTNPRDDR